MELVSVIIPIYNIENALSRCLESVLNQTYKELEIILIDDGSTDGSGKICDFYAEKDKRIVVIHKKNEGVSVARNKGLEIASGDYIGFIDGDDVVEVDMYEVLVRNANKFKTDISMCQMDTINVNGVKDTIYTHEVGIIDTRYVIENFFFDNFVKSIMYSQCNKIFRRDKIKNLRYKRYKYGEDILFVFESLLKAEIIHYDDYVGYHYIHRNESAMISNFSINRLDYLKAGNDIVHLCEDYYPEVTDKAQAWLYQHILIFNRNVYLLDNKEKYVAFLRESKDYIKKNKRYLKLLPWKRKMDYLGVEYCPIYFRILNLLKKRYK